MENRRQFTRVVLSLKAQATLAGNTFDVNLIDLSLHGALVSTSEALTDVLGQNGTLHLELSADVAIDMSFKIVHQEANTLGLECQLTDIDSISHIRRMVELNLGDSELLNRELGLLSEYHE